MQRRCSIPNSVDDTGLVYFRLLFCRRRQRNVQRFITHAQSYFLLIKPFVVLVCLSSLLTDLDVPKVVLFICNASWLETTTVLGLSDRVRDNTLILGKKLSIN